MTLLHSQSPSLMSSGLATLILPSSIRFRRVPWMSCLKPVCPAHLGSRPVWTDRRSATSKILLPDSSNSNSRVNFFLWCHELLVPLSYLWRERGQSRWRLGWWRLILLLCVVGGGCGWEEYCSVLSTLVKWQKQSGTQNCRIATQKTVEPGVLDFSQYYQVLWCWVLCVPHRMKPSLPHAWDSSSSQNLCLNGNSNICFRQMLISQIFVLRLPRLNLLSEYTNHNFIFRRYFVKAC